MAQALTVMKALFKKNAINNLLKGCEQGQTFAKTLEDSHFEKRVIYIIKCCEEAGSLLQGLQKAAEYSQYHLERKKELNKKLRYPFALFAFMIVILGSVYFFFLPQLSQFYQNFQIEGDQHLLNIALMILGGSISVLLLIGGATFLTLKCHHQTFLIQLKHALFHFPLLKTFFQKLFSYYFSSQWLVFLNCGLPLKESLLMMREFETIPMIRMMISEFEIKLESGTPLEVLFNQSPYFQPYFKLIMQHALQIGQVQVELNHYTKSELKQLTTLLNHTFKVIQVTFLILIGVMIILIYLSLLQPVFQMAQLL